MQPKPNSKAQTPNSKVRQGKLFHFTSAKQSTENSDSGEKKWGGRRE